MSTSPADGRASSTRRSSFGRDVAAVQGDVQSLDDLDRIDAKVAKEKGKIDILVASSGFVEHQKLGEITTSHYDKTFRINARGLLFTVQKALPLIREGGSIILISSILALQGPPGARHLQCEQGGCPLL